MTIRHLIMPALMMAALLPVEASSLNLDYSVFGSGGLSGPQAALSDDPFWWIDNTGNIPGTVLSSYGFVPFLIDPQFGTTDPSPFIDLTSGSLLVSSPFDLEDGATLDVGFTVFTNQFTAFEDFGFAVLLRDSGPDTVLYNTRPDGITAFGDIGVIPTLVGSDPGVTEIASTGGPLDLMLNGESYSPAQPDTSYCGQRCSTAVTASYAPGRGTYQLLFGSFTGEAHPPGHSSALAVQAVAVDMPEPEAWLLLFLDLGVMSAFALWYTRFRRQRS